MIKLGDAYFDEASITAIIPCDADGCHIVHFDRGGFYQWIASAAEVQRRLEEVGLIAPEPQAVPLGFLPDEIQILTNALKQGYNYAARDSTGQVYAYRDLPEKGERCWNAVGSGPQTIRLHGAFTALSWDDESPLIIATALEGVLGC